MTELFTEFYSKYAQTNGLLPIKISDFYYKKVQEEVATIGTGGPLYLSVVPTYDKINVKTSMETRDYVEEYKHMPVEGADYIIQKYEDRVLLILTEQCFSHCQYCFRTYNLVEYQKNQLKYEIKNKISMLKTYLSEHKEIKEIILSGGDPLTVGYDVLSYVLSELNDWDIRLHTRAIVYNPIVFDESLVKLLKKAKIRLVFHINHPYEICEDVKKKIRKLDKMGVRMYAQFPLLRGINDHYLVLKELLLMMDQLHIRPISIFIPDPVSYGACYRISYERILSIMDELNWHTPSWINSVRFVLDTTCGKVRRENMIERTDNCILFSRNGKNVRYYDLDTGIDVPTDLNKLLWKNKFKKIIGEKKLT